jgi:hypothetical protein
LLAARQSGSRTTNINRTASRERGRPRAVRRRHVGVICWRFIRSPDPKHAEDTNWRTRADFMPFDVFTRYNSVVARLKHQHPRVDWNGINEMDSSQRWIARWRFEVRGPPRC